MAGKRPNVILIAIECLRPDHMGLYGYRHQTTPHLDRFAQGGTVFENAISPHIPTTPAFGSMLTGRDCFGTDTVALRHKGSMAPDAPTLPEVLREGGYDTLCVGFARNPAVRGFAEHLDFLSWGGWQDRPLRKAENLCKVALPRLRRFAASEKPFFLLLRYMDPHTPYLPPAPFDRAFYTGNEFDPTNKSMEPVLGFKPLADYFATWMPPGVTDADYVVAQYDGEIAYMDSCLQDLLDEIAALGLEEDTLVVIVGDHGETLCEHDCYFDHHGLYECTLRVPLVLRMPGRIPAGLRLPGSAALMDVTPTVLDFLGIRPPVRFEGQSLLPDMMGQERAARSEFYITECTWMRKHGWRTPEWKLIHALEPDFHFKAEVELYNLVDDPGENRNLAQQRPEVVASLEARMQAHIARREKETGRPNPMHTNPHWHGVSEVSRPFVSSQEAYDTLHAGQRGAAEPVQDREPKK